jgi:Trk K+ transport system NAD-binding subunit
VFGERDVLPVLDPNDRRRVLSVLTQDAVIEAYNQAVLDVELLEGTASLMASAERTRQLDLGEGTGLMEIEVSSRLAGRRLKELHLRRDYDSQIMLVKRRGGADKACERSVPGPDFELKVGDVMLVVGSHEGLARLAAL